MYEQILKIYEDLIIQIRNFHNFLTHVEKSKKCLLDNVVIRKIIVFLTYN